MSLWHADYFQAENNQGPKDSGRRTFDLPLNCLKNVDREPISGREILP